MSPEEQKEYFTSDAFKESMRGLMGGEEAMMFGMGEMGGIAGMGHLGTARPGGYIPERGICPLPKDVKDTPCEGTPLLSHHLHPTPAHHSQLALHASTWPIQRLARPPPSAPTCTAYIRVF